MTKRRCDWCKGDHLYENYHDIVWGVPVFEDNILFESLTLEIFQSGLSWITILKKREGFLKAFDSFDIYKIAAYDIKKEKELIANTNIVRNNLKIKATINNAKAIIRIQEEYNSFSKYIWAYVNNDPIINVDEILVKKNKEIIKIDKTKNPIDLNIELLKISERNFLRLL